MSEHSSIPPSSLSRVRKCPASLVANATDDTTNDAAIEGTTAHWLAEQTLQGIAVNIGDICPETHMEVTEDMVHYTQMHVDYVRELIGQGADAFGIEKCVRVPQVHRDCWGTLDFYAYNGVLYVTDLKYGFKLVEPVDNEQLMTYARGIANDLKLPDTSRVVLVIVQPRAWHRLGPVREYHTTLEAINQHICDIRDAVNEGLKDNPRASTGSHCMYCVKAVDCEALNAATYNAIDVSMIANNDCDFDNKHLSLVLENLERAKTAIDIRKNALETRAIELIKEGEVVPGYESAPTFSRRTWVKPNDEMKAFGNLLNVDLTKEVIISPAEAEKKGIKKDVVKKLTATEKTGFKLKRDNNSIARMIFSKEV